MQIIRMKYSRYKNHYSDCETICDSYCKQNKTIEVMIPDGRMKNSGVRGKSYHYYEFNGIENGTGRKVTTIVKAVSVENARSKLANDCVWE